MFNQFKNKKLKQCRLEVFEKSKLKKEDLKISIKRAGIINQTNIQGEGSFQSYLLLESGKKGSLDTPAGRIDFTCRVTVEGDAHIKVVLENKIQTSLFLKAGQIISLGGMAESKNSKKNGFGFRRGIKQSKSKKSSMKNYFLKYESL